MCEVRVNPKSGMKRVTHQGREKEYVLNRNWSLVDCETASDLKKSDSYEVKECLDCLVQEEVKVEKKPSKKKSSKKKSKK